MVSVRGRLINTYLRMTGYKHRMVKAIEAGERFRSNPTDKQTADHHITNDPITGRDVYTIRPQSNAVDAAPERVLIFFHGGAYFYDIMDIHISGHCALADAANVPIVLPSYPLAPEASPKDIRDFAIAVFDNMRARYPNATIIVGGDSAGGGLAVQVVLAQRDAGANMPAALILWSPWVDVSCSNPELVEADKRSVVIGIDGVAKGGAVYAGGEDPKDPMLSPIYADLSGLSPTHIWTGTRDVLYPDIARFGDALKAAGVETHMTVEPDQNHMWMYMPQPEAKTVRLQTAKAILSA